MSQPTEQSASRIFPSTASTLVYDSPPTGDFRVTTPDGLTLAAQAQGEIDAPEILFVHGLGQSHLSWACQVSDPALSGYRIVTFDLRGHGGSDKPLDESAYSEGEHWADDIAAVIAVAGLRRPVLVAWSIGGLMILHYLKKHGGNKIAGINLVNAVTGLSPGLVRAGPPNFPAMLASEDFGMRTTAIAAFLEACFVTLPPRAELVRMLVFNGMVPRAVHQAIFRISVAGLDEALASFAGSVVVTFGAHDPFFYPAMAERVCLINPRATLSIYPDAGHSPFYEAPVRFNQELAALVDEGARKYHPETDTPTSRQRQVLVDHSADHNGKNAQQVNGARTSMIMNGAELTPASALPACKLIPPGESFVGKQGLTYTVGISADSVGARGIHLQIVTIPPGVTAKAHKHAGHESAIYAIAGTSHAWHGERLEYHSVVQPGDFFYIPADMPHLPYNPSQTEPCVVLVARTDPNEQESVVLLPELVVVDG